MNRYMVAAAFAAALLTGGMASAATLVYSPSVIGAPSGANKVTSATIGVGDFVTSTEILAPGDTAEFKFTASQNLKIDGIALSGTGSNFGTDLANVEFGKTLATTDTWSQIFTFPGGTSSSVGFLAGLSLMKGEMFSIFFEDGIKAPVGVTASFSTTPIPVPAALPLLVGALGLLGVVRRKRAA